MAGDSSMSSLHAVVGLRVSESSVAVTCCGLCQPDWCGVSAQAALDAQPNDTRPWVTVDWGCLRRPATYRASPSYRRRHTSRQPHTLYVSAPLVCWYLSECLQSVVAGYMPYLTLPSGWAGCYTCPALRPYQFGPMRNPDVTRRSQ